MQARADDNNGLHQPPNPRSARSVSMSRNSVGRPRVWWLRVAVAAVVLFLYVDSRAASV